MHHIGTTIKPIKTKNKIIHSEPVGIPNKIMIQELSTT